MTVHRTRVGLIGALVAAALSGGCGGGGGVGTVPGQTGTVVIEVQWPERAEIQSQLVPELSEFIKVEIVDLRSGAVRVSDTIARPTGPPWTTETRYERIHISSRAKLTAVAFPVDPTSPNAVAQAGGSMPIVIPAGGIAYPFGRTPGDPIELSMTSTVDHVTITGGGGVPDGGGPYAVGIGETLQLTASARDQDGSILLVPGFDWSSDNGSASVDEAGLVTARRAGQTEISAAETESGISSSVTVEVRSPFEDRDDAVFSPHGSVPVGSGAYRGDRYAMEMRPGGEGRIGIFDRQTDELLLEIQALPGSSNDLKGLAWSSDGAHLAVNYHGGLRPGITIYATDTGQMELRTTGDCNFPHFVVFSDSGDALLVSCSGSDVETIPIVSMEVPITIAGVEGG